MAEGKRIFSLYTDLIKLVNGTNEHGVEVEKMSDKEAGQLFRWILEYVNDQHPKVPKAIKYAVAQVKKQLDEDLEKWKKKCAVNQLNGTLGGRPKKTEKTQNNPLGFNETHDNPEKPDKDKDKDKDINNIKENNTPINRCVKEKTTQSRFSAPTLEELEEYAKEHALEKYNTTNSLLDCERFINHYESNGWMVGKNKMKNWKFAANNWMATNVKDHPELLDDDIYGGFRRLDETDEDYETRQNGGFQKL